MAGGVDVSAAEAAIASSATLFPAPMLAAGSDTRGTPATSAFATAAWLRALTELAPFAPAAVPMIVASLNRRKVGA